MKNIFTLSSLLLLLGSCGGSTAQGEQQIEETPSEIISKEENAVVEQVIEEVQADISEIQEDTEDSLQEVDSLLNNL